MTKRKLTCSASVPRWLGIVVIALAGLSFCGVEIHRAVVDPDIVLLRGSQGAQWMREDAPFDVAAHFAPPAPTRFTVQVKIDAGVRAASMRVTALRRFTAGIDDTELYQGNGPDWKRPVEIQLPVGAQGGCHTLWLEVSNDKGPGMARVVSSLSGVQSPGAWRAENQLPVVSADELWEPSVVTALASSRRDIVRCSLLIIALLVAGFLLMRGNAGVWAPRLRWLLLVVWVIEAGNNFSKIPLAIGYDADSHYKFIDYLVKNRSLPRPDAGWQYFQSPLFYALAAGFYSLLTAGLAVSAHGSLLLLRFIPLACGAMMIEVSYRAARIVFPDAPALAMIATVVGSLVPMNIYMAQTVSNESLAAVLSALVFLRTLRICKEPALARSIRYNALTGIVLGIAMLTKISAAMWAVPLATVMAIALWKQRVRSSGWITAGAVVCGCALLMVGWLFVRNERLVGRPFYLESSVTGSSWWQEPGYRTPAMLLRFGHVFSRPIYNGNASLWDGLYGTLWGNGLPAGRVSWNFGLMSCCLWLSAPIMLAVLVGIATAVIGYPSGPTIARGGVLISVLAITCFLAAIINVYLTLPIYSCAKASYMLSACPCVGILAAGGMLPLAATRWMRPIGAYLLCWGALAYLTYFVW